MAGLSYRRHVTLPLLLVLGPLALLLLVLSTAAQATPGLWTATGSMNFGRYNHTATRLQNGKVLVAGGTGNSGPLSSAELFDPVAGVWTATGSMNVARPSHHTATLLPNGKVLVAGGGRTIATFGSAELYDPSTGVWTATGSLNMGRFHHTTTLLPNGKVLVAGGADANLVTLRTAELYDPGTGTWTATGSMREARQAHTATLLTNGTVLGTLLVVGGFGTAGRLDTAELYDPGTGVWTATGSMNSARVNHTATLLTNGTVLGTLLVVGGVGGAGSLPLRSAELYDLGAGVWTAMGSMYGARYGHTATLLPNGTVLVAAGFGTAGRLDTAELYDPGTSVWTPTGSLISARDNHTTTLLSNGTVLVAGGFGTLRPLSSAELYDPFTVNPAPAIVSASHSTFTVGTAGSLTVTATGRPTPTLSVSGTLPAGMTFNGASGVLSGIPTVSGAFPLTFTATNGLPPDATQTFTVIVNPAPLAVLTSPTSGATLSATAQLFSWSSVATADTYALWVGSTVGGYDYYYVYCLCTTTTATGLPTDSSTVYVRMWTHTTADDWTFIDYTYTAFTTAAAP